MTNRFQLHTLLNLDSKSFSFSIEYIQTIFKEYNKELDILYSIFLNKEFIYIERCGVTNF